MHPAPSAIVFVFGSNLAGRHGRGAALHAKMHFGAEYGVGEGPTGRSYALPTKDENLKTRDLESIAGSISRFAEYAKNNPETLFLVTPIGTGLAGHSRRDIWKLLAAARVSENVALSSSWLSP